MRQTYVFSYGSLSLGLRSWLQTPKGVGMPLLELNCDRPERRRCISSYFLESLRTALFS